MNEAATSSDAAILRDSAVLATEAVPVDSMLALLSHFHAVGLLSIAAWIGAILLAGKHFGRASVAKIASFAVMAWLGGILAWSCWNASGIRCSEVNMGVQTIATWGAVALFLLAMRKDARLNPYRLLLGFGIAGVLLAALTARNIDDLEIDLGQQLEERQEIVNAALSEEEKAAEATGSLDDVSMPVTEEQSIYEKAAAEEESVPRYRQSGKKTRAEGKTAETTLTKAAKEVEGETMADRVAVPEDQKYRAVKAATLNVFAARLVFLTIVLVLIIDYLRRFNSTFSFLYPLPIAGRLPDRFGTKANTVALATQEQEIIAGLLAALVRKGETFIYFGPNPKVGDKLCRLRLLGCERALAVQHFGDDTAPSSSEYVFESAWFGRYAFCVSGEALTATLLDELIAFFAARTPAQARTRRVLNIVLAAEIVLSGEQHAALAKQCEDMNLRLIDLVDGPAAAYDEVVAAVPATERSMILEYAP
jgi:hypothetical protein